MKYPTTILFIFCTLKLCCQTFNFILDIDNQYQGLHDIIDFNSNLIASGWNINNDGANNILGISVQDDEILNWVNNYGIDTFHYTENHLLLLSDSTIFLVCAQVADYDLNPYNNDVLLLHLNGEGGIIENKTYGSFTINEGIFSLIEFDNVIYATGFYQDIITLKVEAFLWLFSPTGDSLTLYTYGHPSFDFLGKKIIRTQNGDFLIAGYTRDDGDYDRLLMRIAPNGDLLWYQIYPGVDDFPGTYDVFNSMIELEDNSILLAGRFTDNDDDLDANLVKVDADGNIIWDMLYGEYNSNAFEELDIRNDTVFIGGSTVSGIPSGYVDAWITAMDTAGNIYWSHTYNPDGIADNEADDYLYDFTLTGDGGMAFCGWSRRETQDAWVMKLDANGLCDTAACFPDLVNIYPDVLQGNPTPRLYPNPADAFLFIQSAITKNVAVQIWNMQGSLVLENYLNGNITSLNITHLPSGIYAARFIRDGEIFGEQMFVVE